jgi:hypothetical protein
MANENQNQRDIAANRVISTLGGQEMARLLTLTVGNRVAYKQYDEMDLGAFVDYGPIPFRATFAVTKNKMLRDISKSEEEMKKDYQMVMRFMATDRKKPLTVTNLMNVRFTSIVQVYPGGNQQPFEEVTGTAQQVSHDD